MVEQGFESVSKYFGDDLERNAQKKNMDFISVQSNESVIFLFQQMIFLQKIPNTMKNNILNCVPILVKEGSEELLQKKGW